MTASVSVSLFLDELRMRAEQAPQAQALRAPGEKPITFSALLNRIDAVAGTLHSAGIARGDVVAVVMADGPDLLATILGVASGATCAPINPALRHIELEALLKDLDARALITDRPLDFDPGIRVLDARPAPGISAAREPAASSDVALLLQTSATTGKPRLVPMTHANLSAMAANTRKILRLSQDDCFLSLMPLFHLQGLLSSLAQLLEGGRVVSTAGFDASAFVNWMEEFCPTWYTATPPLHNAIVPLMEARPDLRDRVPLRFVRSIGAPLPETLRTRLEEVLGAQALEGYGLTEAGMVTSNAPAPGGSKPGSVGRAGGVEIAILEAGEIAVRGPAVIRGYRNNPEADRIAFRNGWLLTGDTGYLDSDGFLFVTGRIKDIINRGGEKVLPAEVDEVLAAHPLVAEAVAFGVPHPTMGEDVAAAVVLRPGASIDEAQLRRFAAERLAAFKVPRRILFLDAVPKGPTGKALRAVLAEQFAGAETSAPQAAVTALEKTLEKMWKRILRVDRIGIQDEFFEAGGDSLGLALLLSEVELECGVALEETDDFFSRLTIEAMAEAIARCPAEAKTRSRSFLVPLQPAGDRVPFFCIPGADENPYYFRDLAKALGTDRPFYALRDPRPGPERGLYSLEEHAAHFAAAIRSALAQGPYFLGGHCYGGILAYEVARQLVAAGQKVGFLALIESPAPGYPKVIRNWRNYLRQARRATIADMRSHAHVLARLMRKKAQGATRRGLMAARLKSVVQPEPLIDRRNQLAGRSYRPGELRCPVVQFISGEQVSALVLEDPRLGWRDSVGAGFSVRSVKCAHKVLFRDPFVSDLASQLRGLLEEASAR